ncbi:MAG: amidohydrolase family protein [Alphaproteobacteria bacterium]|nr:amidohydrolase family protein [Alphaproteobacteria bacterium]
MTHRIIDADGHICETRSLWEEYIPQTYRDRAIRIERGDDGRDRTWVNGEVREDLLPATACLPWGMDDPDNPPTWDDITPGSYDGAARVEVMDEEGIDHCLLFPSMYLLSGDIAEADVAAAACHGYNEWIADMCRDGSGRLDAVGLVPLQSPDAALKEVAHIVQLGLKGVAFRPERYNGLALHDEVLAPFWNAVSDQGLFAAVHGSFGAHMPSFANSRYKNTFFTHMICHPFEQMAACLDIVAGGVLQRHPELRVAFLESGLGWLEYWLGRMDEHFEVMGAKVPWLTRRPSELFREQCFISIEADEAHRMPKISEMDLQNCVFWGADYPHYDCTYPGAVTELEENLAPLDPALADLVRGGNAARFIGLG